MKHFNYSRILLLSIVTILYLLAGCQQANNRVDNVYELAKKHVNDLRLSVYFTAHDVERLLSQNNGRREAVSLLRANGITKVYIEVYRSGLIVSPELLKEIRDFFTGNGLEVVGGIATVPGRDFGVKQEGQLGWFNWQNEKTQNDLRKVVVEAAPIFDEFIVDDFLCTGDTSIESKNARGGKSWSLYRRQLMTTLASTIFIEPARSVNPDIRMIIKYPQWYDRFHLFGYDVESGPQLFDKVWVGTESRGQYTQRFGFVQPYEGFVNFRWISSLSGGKVGGAWFDHIDCDASDFVEQACQSVLAGAQELVFFNYGNFVNDHPGHHLLRMDLEQLFALAKAVQLNPVVGIPGYKPPHSDAGGDLYIMDFIGMMGIPLIPVSKYPENAATLFLPTQAASDPDIVGRVEKSLARGTRIIATAGFLAKVEDGNRLADKAEVTKPVIKPMVANMVIVGGEVVEPVQSLELEATFTLNGATTLLMSQMDGRQIPYMTCSTNEQFYVINSHTFSEADFEAVGEVLLCPRPLGIIDLPQHWANTIRGVFNHELPVQMNAPTRVTYQPLANGEIVLHNYNKEPVELQLTGIESKAPSDAFTGEQLTIQDQTMKIKLNARSRIWVRP